MALDSKTKKSFADLVLVPATIDGYGQRFVSIGPFGARVGFSFQQQRALNLVYALHILKKIDQGQRIAILGGGLAGITARLALRGLGYADVDLYEERADVVTLQSQAYHRMVHPNYNDWPIADRFSATTDLPFLNWYMDKATLVVSELRKAWHEEYADRLTKPLLKHEVERIEADPDPDDKSKVKRLFVVAKRIGAHGGGESKQAYDHVIAATGFGAERDLKFSCAASYWTSDELDSMRSAGVDSTTISAIGDGGLIDCIRMCFKETGEDRMMAIELISHIRHAKYRIAAADLDMTFIRSIEEQRIADLEAEAASRVPHAAEKPEDFGTKSENEIALLLFEGYQKILRVLPKGAIELLDRLVTNVEMVTLVGRLEKPFSCATAPINKLIMAYLLQRRPDLYIRGRIEWDKDGSGNKTTMRIIRYDGQDGTYLGAGKTVLRLGSQPPVYKFAPDFEATNKSIHRALRELTASGRCDREICADIVDVACADRTSRDFLKKRLPLATKFAKQHLPFSLCLGANHSGAVDHFTLKVDEEKVDYEAEIDDAVRKLGGFPHDLFGVPLMPEFVKVAGSALRVSQ